MERLAFLVDEHVPSVFTAVLEANGYDVVRVTDRLGQRSDDEQILRLGDVEELVVLTNDRDFVELASTADHAGIVLYTDRTLLIGDPVGSTETISAIDRFYSPPEMRNTVEWLDNWR